MCIKISNLSYKHQKLGLIIINSSKYYELFKDINKEVKGTTRKSLIL